MMNGPRMRTIGPALALGLLLATPYLAWGGTDPLLAEVQRTAGAAQASLSSLQAAANKIQELRKQLAAKNAEVKAAKQRGQPAATAELEQLRELFKKQVTEQSDRLTKAEGAIGAYTSAEDNFKAKYGYYVYPDLHGQVVSGIISAKSDVALHKALLDESDAAATSPKGPPKGGTPLPEQGAKQAADKAAPETPQPGAKSGAKSAALPGPRAPADARAGLGASIGGVPSEARYQRSGGPAPGAGPSAQGLPSVEAPVKPGSPKATGSLAGSGRHEEAEKAALEAIRLNPMDAGNYVALAWAQLHLKKYTDALDAIEKALAISPNDPRALAARASIYEQLGLRQEMLEDLRRAAALSPARYRGLLRRARAGRRLFDPSDSESDLLLEGLSPLDGKAAPIAWCAGLGTLCFLAAGFIARRKPKDKSVVGIGKVWAAELERERKEAPPEPAPAAPADDGKLFAGKYRLARQLAASDRSVLWAAEDVSLDRPVLVRCLKFGAGEAEARLRSRACKEIRLLADMNHPGIETVLGIVETGPELRVILEATSWTTAESLLKASGRLPFNRARHVVRQACGALWAAHQRGLLHRCLTPARILVSEQAYVRLTDFGAWGGYELEYRAPETEAGKEVFATDVYSLGATFYALLAGRPPYDGDIRARRAKRDFQAPSACAEGIPAAVDALVRDALDPVAAERLPSARAFLERLSGI